MRIVVTTVLGALALAPAADAAINVSRAELSSGRLRVEGTGAVPGNGVTVDDKGVFGVADGAGSFRVEASNFSSPTCVVLVSDGASSVQAKLSGCTATQEPPPPLPPAPNLLSPAGGATVVQPVTLSWSEVTDPAGPIIGYDWQVATSSTFGSTIRAWGTAWYPADGVPALTSDRFSGIPDGVYHWRVRSIRKGSLGESPVHSNWSSVRTLTVSGSVAGTLPPPALTKPANDKQYHPWEYFDIEWNAVPGAAHYVIEYDDEPAFDYPIDNTSGRVNGTWANGAYGFEAGWVYWRVRSVNADGVRSLPSPARRFGIFHAAPLPPPPTLVAPTDGATVQFPLILDWTDVENAQPGGYMIQVHQSPDFGGSETSGWLAWTGPQSYFYWDSLPAGTWYWRVNSAHGHSAPAAPAWTGWSAVRRFVVPAAPPALVAIGTDRASAYSGRNAGNEPYGWVQLTTPAPAGGLVVDLAASDPGAVGVPDTITVAAGKATAFFDIDPLQVLVDTPVTLSATYEGVTKTVEFLVKPPDLQRLDIGSGVPAHQVFPAGTSTVATALVNGKVPPEGAVVEFASSSPHVVVPASARIEGGWASANVDVTTNRSITASVTATITATWKGQTVSAQITIHPPPTLVAPANAASAASGSTVTFDWADLDGISYWIQVDDSPQFTAPLFVDQSPSRTSSFQTSSLPVGTLYWRVQTLDMYGHRGDWSEVRTLTITGASTPPATPSLLFPADGTRYRPGQTVTFDWSDVNGATSYTIQVDDSSTFGSPFVLDQQVNASQHSTNTLPTRQMWWRVRANNAAGSSAWTSARRVEVKN